MLMLRFSVVCVYMLFRSYSQFHTQSIVFRGSIVFVVRMIDRRFCVRLRSEPSFVHEKNNDTDLTHQTNSGLVSENKLQLYVHLLSFSLCHCTQGFMHLVMEESLS